MKENALRWPLLYMLIFCMQLCIYFFSGDILSLTFVSILTPRERLHLLFQLPPLAVFRSGCCMASRQWWTAVSLFKAAWPMNTKNNVRHDTDISDLLFPDRRRVFAPAPAHELRRFENLWFVIVLWMLVSLYRTEEVSEIKILHFIQRWISEQSTLYSLFLYDLPFKTYFRAFLQNLVEFLVPS